jgi:hypothetical protein
VPVFAADGFVAVVFGAGFASLTNMDDASPRRNADAACKHGFAQIVNGEFGRGRAKPCKMGVFPWKSSGDQRMGGA